MTEQELIDAAAFELEAHPTAGFIMPLTVAFQLAALIQLALRHPRVAEQTRGVVPNTAARFLETLDTALAELNLDNARKLLEMGNDPNFDPVGHPDVNVH